MRFLVLLAALAACTPAEPPPIPSSNDLRSPRIRYICLPSDELAVIYITLDGVELEPLLTGDLCDYAAAHPK